VAQAHAAQECSLVNAMLEITEKEKALVRFLWDVQETVGTMEEGLTRLQQEGANLELIEKLTYLAYRVREDALSAGLQEVSELARILENVFEQARKGQVELTSDLLSLLTPSCEALRRMTAGGASGEEAGGLGERGPEIEAVGAATESR
jgi:two-component system chemotaxis sensor kinase CheA